MSDTYHKTTVVDSSETTRLKEENACLRQTLQSVRAENGELWLSNNALRETLFQITKAMFRVEPAREFILRDGDLVRQPNGHKTLALLKAQIEENLKRELESAPPTSTMPA